MNQTTVEPSPASIQSWHLWAVGLVSLLWNGFGAYAYSMIHLRDPGYLAQFPAEMMPTLDAFPAWVTAAWAFGVWGSVAGSILLLLRSRYAQYAFVVALAGLIVCLVYWQASDVPPALDTSQLAWMTLAILAVLIGEVTYARAMRRRGVLR